MSKHSRLAIALAALAAGSAAAGPLPATGNTSDPANWRFAPGQSFNGVAGALDGVARLTFANSDGLWACSGSLLAGGAYVLTAGHCADDFSSMKVEFNWYNGSAQVTRTVAPGDAFVHPSWHGAGNSLDNGADLAILKLSAPVTGIAGFQLSGTNDIGRDYLMAGYGTTSTGDSSTDPTWADVNFGHFGYNTFDVGSQAFNRVASQYVPGWTYDAGYYAPGLTYMSDFDDPTVIGGANTLGRIANVTGNQWTSGGAVGPGEALIAGGDSGGGDFVWDGHQWLLSGVHSWGWEVGGQYGVCSAFGLANCDSRPDNGTSYGDLSGSTATFDQLSWISSVTAVPEPQSFSMLLAGMIALFSLSRRR